MKEVFALFHQVISFLLNDREVKEKFSNSKKENCLSNKLPPTYITKYTAQNRAYATAS